MEIFSDLLKILVPSAVVLYGMYFTVKAFLDKQLNEQQLQLKKDNAAVVLPLRLQAYERMTLFLERISPQNLLLRLPAQSGFEVSAYQQVLLAEIRQEFNHNLAQQIYISHTTWSIISNAKETVISTINQATQGLSPNEPALNLSRKIIETIVSNNVHPTDEALKKLKEEVQQLFI